MVYSTVHTDPPPPRLQSEARQYTNFSIWSVFKNPQNYFGKNHSGAMVSLLEGCSIEILIFGYNF